MRNGNPPHRFLAQLWSCAAIALALTAPATRADYETTVTGTTTGTVWGSGPYTSNSHIGAAAVHAGLLLPGQTATLRVLELGWHVEYYGSTANGVTTQDYLSSWAAISLELVTPAGGNTPPEIVSFNVTPAAAAAGDTVTVSLHARDLNGNMSNYVIRHVGFGGINASGLGAPTPSSTEFTDTFTYTIPSGAATGSNTFRAEVGDTASVPGDAATYGISTQIVQVDTPTNQPPACTISASASTIRAGQSLTLSVSGSDADGNLRYLNIDQLSPNSGTYGPGETAGEIPPNNGSYDLGTGYASRTRELALILQTPGTYTLRGAANDGGGWVQSSNTVSVMVTNQPPTASVAGDTNVTMSGGSATGTWMYSAGDPDGNLRQWRLRLARLPDAFNDPGWSTTNPTVTFPYTFTTPGNYKWRFEAQDSSGAISADEWPFTIAAMPVLPTGVFDSINYVTAPTPLLTLLAGQTLTARGWAADENDGSPVASVLLYIDGALVGNAHLDEPRQDVADALGRPAWNRSGWSFAYVVAAALAGGTHTIEARAFDSSGASVIIGSRTFAVPAAPSAVITLDSPGQLTVRDGTKLVISSQITAPSGTLTEHYFTLNGALVPTDASSRQASGTFSKKELTYLLAQPGQWTVQAAARTQTGQATQTYLSFPSTVTVVAGDGAPVADAVYHLHDRTFASGENVAIVQNDAEIWAGPAVHVAAGANLALYSGTRLRFRPGFHALRGSAFRATMTAAPPGAPVITSLPTAAGTVNVPFSYTITATQSPISYDAAGLPAWLSRTDNVLSGTPPAAGSFANIALSATNNIGTGTAPLTITIYSSSAPPVITIQPANQSTAPGGAVTFTAAASGIPAPTYQWRKNNVAIAGATTTTLELTNVPVADSSSSYTMVATNIAGSATTVEAILIVSFDPSDLDGDGVTNSLELSLGLDPNNPNDVSVQRFIYDKTNQLQSGPGGTYVKDAEGNVKEVR